MSGVEGVGDTRGDQSIRKSERGEEQCCAVFCSLIVIIKDDRCTPRRLWYPS